MIFKTDFFVLQYIFGAIVASAIVKQHDNLNL